MKKKKRILNYLIACDNKLEIEKLDLLNEEELMVLYFRYGKQRKVKKLLSKISNLLK